MGESNHVSVRIGEEIDAKVVRIVPGRLGFEITSEIRHQLGLAGGRLLGKRNVEILDSKKVPAGDYVFIGARAVTDQGNKRPRIIDDGYYGDLEIPVSELVVVKSHHHEAIKPIGEVWAVERLCPTDHSEQQNVIVRPNWHELWTKLEALTDFQRLSVWGPSGVGKTTVLEGWIQYKRKTKNILYLHFIKTGDQEILYCTRSGIEKYHIDGWPGEYEWRVLDRILMTLRNERPIDIVVADGYLEDPHMTMIYGVFSAFQEHIVVHCSSDLSACHIGGSSIEYLCKRNLLVFCRMLS